MIKLSAKIFNEIWNSHAARKKSAENIPVIQNEKPKFRHDIPMLMLALE